MSYAPKYGGQLPTGFDPQFPDAPINHYSMSVVLIELLANDGSSDCVSHGTGFLWRDASSKTWLITAYHVLSGKSPFDGSDISRKMYEPRRARVHFGLGSANHIHGRAIHEFELYLGASPRWACDPEFDRLRTDIVAMPVDIGRSDLVCLNDDPNFGKHDHLFSFVGFPCFIAGYPTIAVEGFETPIWRSGSFASDPRLAIDGKPIFLVDAATGPGFSGGPVFRMHIGPAPFVDPKMPTGMSIEADAILRTSFVGVYSGRLDHPHLGAQTPYVFYANRIPLIVGANAHLSAAQPAS